MGSGLSDQVDVMLLINRKNTEGNAYSIGKTKHSILDTLFGMPEGHPSKDIQQITGITNLKLKGDTRTGQNSESPQAYRRSFKSQVKTSYKEDQCLKDKGTYRTDPGHHLGRTKENPQWKDNKVKEMENFKK